MSLPPQAGRRWQKRRRRSWRGRLQRYEAAGLEAGPRAVPPNREVDPGACFVLGYQRQSGAPIFQEHSDTRPILYLGRTGAGKSTALRFGIEQAHAAGIPLSLFDNKGDELRRIVRRFPDLLIPIFRPEHERSEFLAPVHPNEAFSYLTLVIECLGVLTNLRVETRAKLIANAQRELRAHPPDRPPLSLEQFVQFQELLAKREGKRLQSGLDNLTYVLELFGKRSRVCTGPTIDDRYPIAVREWQHLSDTEQQAHASIYFDRLFASLRRYSVTLIMAAPPASWSSTRDSTSSARTA